MTMKNKFYNKYVKSFVTAISFTAVLVLAACSFDPQELTDSETSALQDIILPNYFEKQEQINKPLTVYHAIAYALKYNVSRRIAVLTELLSREDLELSDYNLLPNFVMSSNYSYSDPRDSGRNSASNFISTEKKSTTTSLSLSWNILDFGLNYVAARQSRNQSYIAKERRRLAVNQLISDVQQAYWPALSAHRLEKEFEEIEFALNKALEDITSRELQQDIPLRALNEERRLIQLKRQVTQTRADLLRSRIQLANLMGMRPNQQYQLSTAFAYVPVYGLSVQEIERAAFNFRPEVRVASYEKRVTADESLSALLRLLPTGNISSNFSHSSNDLAAINDSVAVASQLSFNLINLFRVSNTKKRNAINDELSEQRRLAIGMSLLTQTRIAHVNYLTAVRDYSDTLRLYQIEEKIEDSVIASAEGGETAIATPIDVLRARLNRVIASLTRAERYGQIHRSAYEVQRTTGIDVLPEAITDHHIDTIAAEVERQVLTGMNVTRVFDDKSLGQAIVYEENLYKALQDIVRIWKDVPEFNLVEGAQSYGLIPNVNGAGGIPQYKNIYGANSGIYVQSDDPSDWSNEQLPLSERAVQYWNFLHQENSASPNKPRSGVSFQSPSLYNNGQY